jgi:hypothetical protein
MRAALRKNIMAQRIPERQLVTELENGNSEHLNGYFNGQFEEERIKSVNRMRDMYLDDVKSGATSPGLMKFDVHHWFGEQISIDYDYKGKNVYQDTFKQDLTHSDPNDVAPPNRKPFDPAEVRKVTTDLENGSPDSLKTALSGLYFEEQNRYIKAVQALNEQDQKSKATGVGLSLSFDFNKGKDMSLGVERSAPGFWNFWSNPQHLYTAKIDQAGNRSVETSPDNRK